MWQSRLSSDGAAAARRCLEELLEVALELLPHGAQRQALRLRYGLADGRPRTLREVGAGMRPPRSVETARQLVADGQAGLGRVLGRLRLTGAMEQHAASVP